MPACLQNKIELVCDVRYKGFEFWVLPEAWLVHLPHAATDARKMIVRDAMRNVNKQRIESDSLYGTVKRMFNAAEAQMEAGNFTASVDDRLIGTFARCSWLREPQHARLHLP